MTGQKKKLRSQAWFGAEDLHGFLHRAWMKNQGWPENAFQGRPVIGICNTFSEYNPCNGHFRQLAERVKLGVCSVSGRVWCVKGKVTGVIGVRGSRADRQSHFEPRCRKGLTGQASVVGGCREERRFGLARAEGRF